MIILYYISGVISVSGELDYEMTREYILKIEARDRGDPPLSSHCTVNIILLDYNDNTPMFGQEKYSAIISEDARMGQRIVQAS